MGGFEYEMMSFLRDGTSRIWGGECSRLGGYVDAFGLR